MQLNPIKELRIQTGMSQGMLAKRVGLTRQYVSKLEFGCYISVNPGVLDVFARELGLDPRIVRFSYAAWQVSQRKFTASQLNPRQLVYTGEGPYYRAFKTWRETYWPTIASFAKDMCLNAYLVKNYEGGRSRSMPVQLKEALEGCDLIREGFKTNAR